MSDSRSRFEAWVGNRLRLGKDSRGDYLNYEPEMAWAAYQAGQADGRAEAARRCAEIVGAVDEDLPVDVICESIKAEFPEAWK